MTFVHEYINYYKNVRTADKFWGFYFVPLYYLFLLVDGIVLLVGGILALSYGAADTDNSWGLACIIATPIAAWFALINSAITCSPFPVACDPSYFIRVVAQTIVVIVKAILLSPFLIVEVSIFTPTQE